MAQTILRAATPLVVAFVICSTSRVSGELVGYWSADTTAGIGEVLPNDQGNSELEGELFGGAEYSGDGTGHTGLPGDHAVFFPGEDEDYAVLPATERTFEEITITAWVNGFPNGAWTGIVLSRDPTQAIGIDYHDFDGTLTYIWNDNSAETYGFFSDLIIPEDEWTFLALTVTEEQATFYVGPLGGALESAVNEIEHFAQDNFTEWRLAEDDCCGGARNFSGLIDDVSIWDEALSADDLARLYNLSATPLTLTGGGLLGDFNNDGILDAVDINLLSAKVRDMTNDPAYDVNGDALVNGDDREVWVNDLKRTWFGDAELNGEFSSSDFVLVFGRGHYEDGIDGNSQWEDGDWDGDGDFGSGDFVTAFSAGGYELGPRAAVAAVPEPSTPWWVIAAAALVRRRATDE
jgi:hypothetical protein